MAAELAKVARKYKLAVMPVDQHPTTFLDNRWGRSIWENSSSNVLFHLDDLPAQPLSAAIADLTPDHIACLTHAQPGEAAMILTMCTAPRLRPIRRTLGPSQGGSS